MKQELDERLFKRFSFLHPELPVTQNLMCFGFNCGDGWFDILWKLCEGIERLAKRETGPEEYGKFLVTQVKEKYGGLRFYVNWATDKMYDLIDQAEAKSLYVCEKCGKKGTLRNRSGWYVTLCKKHHKEWVDRK